MIFISLEAHRLHVCGRGFNGTNSSFGEDSSTRIKNIEDAAHLLHLRSQNTFLENFIPYQNQNILRKLSL